MLLGRRPDEFGNYSGITEQRELSLRELVPPSRLEHRRELLLELHPLRARHLGHADGAEPERGAVECVGPEVAVAAGEAGDTSSVRVEPDSGPSISHARRRRRSAP